MTLWRQWVRFPQSLWLRKAFFQIHLWIGIGTGLYVVLMSISGALIVYRPQFSKKFARKDIILTPTAFPLSRNELEQIAQKMHPGYRAVNFFPSAKQNRPVELVLERDQKRLVRLFDPYRGKDLGDPLSPEQQVMEWFVDFHDNLLAGTTGRILNGIAATLVTVLSLAGAIIWWPGRRNWRRGLTINLKANFSRFNWDVHSALGFWCFLFILMWSVSGIYFSFPWAFGMFGNGFLLWLARFHFGRMGWFSRAVWTVVGLVPAMLAITGALMWWDRVWRKRFRQF